MSTKLTMNNRAVAASLRLLFEYVWLEPRRVMAVARARRCCCQLSEEGDIFSYSMDLYQHICIPKVMEA